MSRMRRDRLSENLSDTLSLACRRDCRPDAGANGSQRSTETADVPMSDDLRQIRDQVLKRFRYWEQTGVPDWKYALLLARSFEAVPGAAVLGLLVVDDDSPTLAGKLVEVAHRWAGGGRLTQAEVDSAFELADRVVAAQTSDDTSFWARDTHLLFIETSPHSEWFRTALTEPRRAVAHLISDTDRAGRVWPDRQERCLR